MSDIVISGYYGLGNSGDEALLKSIVDDLKSIKPDISITAFSANKKRTNLLYGIKTVNRYNLFAVANELRKAKLLLSGGGTLIQDATSTKSLLYYLGIISLAKLFKTKVMLYANGIGPIKDKNISKVKKVLDKTDIITLRENDSLKEIERCNIKGPVIKITADPAFNLTCADKTRVDELLSQFGIPKDKKIIVVSVREWLYCKEDFSRQMAQSLDNISKFGYHVVFMPMQMSKDFKISVDISSLMKNKASVIDRELAVDEMLALIGHAQMACGMRLHMLIFASVMDVPMVGIVYDPKVQGFMDYMNQKNYIHLERFNSEEFSKMVAECNDNLDAIKKDIKTTSDKLRAAAQENARYAIELLKHN